MILMSEHIVATTHYINLQLLPCNFWIYCWAYK